MRLLRLVEGALASDTEPVKQMPVKRTQEIKSRHDESTDQSPSQNINPSRPFPVSKTVRKGKMSPPVKAEE